MIAKIPISQVNLVNMVRDPVSRLVSQFYYLRAAKRWARAERPPQEWRTKKLEACVLSGDTECQVTCCFYKTIVKMRHPAPQVGGGGQDMQLTYFCGSHAQCANSSNPAALQLARHNLETRYSVVGVLEHFNTSIAVMEQYLPGNVNRCAVHTKNAIIMESFPAFFSGASSALTARSRANTNPHPEPSVKIK